MKAIALVTSRNFAELSDDDQLLLEPLRKQGFVSEITIWNDPQVQWRKYDAILIRSPWDYWNRFPEFEAWLKRVEPLRVLNPVRTLRWNLNKLYLKELEAQGVPVIPTHWVRPGESVELAQVARDRGWPELILKPIVSANAHETYRFQAGAAAQYQDKLARMTRESGAMIQPYLKEVEEEGEWSFLFFDGKFSHAILKRPKAGDFRVQWTHGGRTQAASASAEDLAQAQRVIDAVQDRGPLLYARVDVIRSQGRMLLGELELAEPCLYLEYSDGAPERFVDALQRLID